MTANLRVVHDDERLSADDERPSPADAALAHGPGAAPSTALLGRQVRYALGDQQRLTGPEPDDLEMHVARFGRRPAATGARGDALVDVLHRIGLSGRGGGHFPVARKWRAVLDAGGGGVVVANGAEGEPASAKDAALLQHRPHLVLDGLELAAEALGADDAVVWLHEGATATRRSVARAVAERGRPAPAGRRSASSPVRTATSPVRRAPSCTH